MTKPLTRIEESILLSLIGKELYGMEIALAIHQSSGNCLYGQNNLSVAFDRLENRGMISSRLAKPQERLEERGGAKRKYYELTSKGADELDKLNEFKKRLTSWEAELEVPIVRSQILSRR